MEGDPLARRRAVRLQAPNAHLPSQATGRCPGRPSAPTTPGEVVVGEVPGGQAGDAGEPWETDGWGRRGQVPDATPAAGARADPARSSAGSAHPPGLDPQTRDGRATPAGDPDAGGPGSPGP